MHRGRRTPSPARIISRHAGRRMARSTSRSLTSVRRARTRVDPDQGTPCVSYHVITGRGLRAGTRAADYARRRARRPLAAPACRRISHTAVPGSLSCVRRLARSHTVRPLIRRTSSSSAISNTHDRRQRSAQLAQQRLQPLGLRHRANDAIEDRAARGRRSLERLRHDAEDHRIRARGRRDP